MLFGVRPLDLPIAAESISVIIVIAVIARYLLAMRAVSVDLVAALKLT